MIGVASCGVPSTLRLGLMGFPARCSLCVHSALPTPLCLFFFFFFFICSFLRKKNHVVSVYWCSVYPPAIVAWSTSTRQLTNWTVFFVRKCFRCCDCRCVVLIWTFKLYAILLKQFHLSVKRYFPLFVPFAACWHPCSHVLLWPVCDTSHFKLRRLLSAMTMVAWIMIRAVSHAMLCRRFCHVTALMWHGEFSLAVSGGSLLIILRTIKDFRAVVRYLTLWVD